MITDIITIGDEILIGQIVDTNSPWLAQRLNLIGGHVARITSVSDDAQEIERAVNESLGRAECVIITGGLGPTNDDITKKTLASMFGMSLRRHEESYKAIGAMLSARGIEFNELNQGQADLPDGCKAIPNPNGTAPGMWFERGGRVVVSMPGVPFEMKAMTDATVIPMLKAYFVPRSIVHRTATTFGLSESELARTIAGWEAELPPYIKLAYLPNPNNMRLRLSSYDVADHDKALAEINDRFDALRKIIPDYFVGLDDDSLAAAIARLLKERGATLSVAESCTGGALASRFTELPGASEYLLGGVVSYSNSIKVKVLGVSEQTLAQYGAVSGEVASQMARGVRMLTGSTYAISTTGVAGPDGGTPEKPVGTVWMAIDTPEGTFTKKMVFGALRSQNIQRAVSNAINMLRLHLTGASGTHTSQGIL